MNNNAPLEQYLVRPPTPIRRAAADPEDPRFADLVQQGWVEGTQIALIGAPFDAGVRAGGGRPGAAGGPAAVREQLCRYGTLHHLEFGVSLEGLRVADLGDMAGDGETGRRGDGETRGRGDAGTEGAGVSPRASRLLPDDALSTIVAEVARRGAVPVVLGGGHDLTFRGVRGLAAVYGAIGGVNVDAHLDVRAFHGEPMSSGMPYRRLLEEVPAFRGDRFMELGIQGFTSAAAHAGYLQERGGTILSLRAARQLGAAGAMAHALEVAERDVEALFVSLDIDSAAQAFAPGCSAPSPDGFTPAELIEIAFAAGRHPKTCYFDLMEINPDFDLDGRTARLGAALVLAFCFGVAARAGSGSSAAGLEPQINADERG